MKQCGALSSDQQILRLLPKALITLYNLLLLCQYFVLIRMDRCKLLFGVLRCELESPLSKPFSQALTANVQIKHLKTGMGTELYTYVFKLVVLNQLELTGNLLFNEFLNFPFYKQVEKHFFRVFLTSCVDQITEIFVVVMFDITLQKGLNCTF